MDSTDLQVLKHCADWISLKIPAALITVVRTWGSSPRPVGSLLGINANGQIVGSVSGGCIEDDLIERIRLHGVPDRPALLNYGVSAEQARQFGLPCGGSVQLVLEPLSSASQIDQLLKMLEQQKLVQRSLQMGSGAIALDLADAGASTCFDGDRLQLVFGPRWRLLIIGAGQMSAFLAEVASGLDYQVTVCDPREEYQQSWQLARIPVLHAMPDDLVIEMKPDARTAVVALTHDPKLDDLALLEALKSEAFYVGAIGSRLNQQRRRERLRLFDLNQQQLDRLHGPVGLSLGGKMPAEIAISILADMIAVKNSVQVVCTPTQASSLDGSADVAGCGI